MTKTEYFLVWCLLQVKVYAQTTPQLTPQICPLDISPTFGAEWPSTSSRVSSDPPCANKNNEILYRSCENGRWGPEPPCVKVQDEWSTECPYGFVDSADICYIVAEKSTYPPKCPYENLVPFNYTLTHLATKVDEPLWVPVTRDLSNGLGPLRWVEPSSLYKMEFPNQYLYDINRIQNQNCLVYDGEDYQAVPCDEEHPGLCGYQKLSPTVVPYCSNLDFPCRPSDLSSKTKCVCMETNKTPIKLAEFVEPYQNVLTPVQCSFGLKRLNGTFVWSSTKQAVNYTYWSPLASFDDDFIYGATTPQGWVLTEELGPCFLIEVEVSDAQVELDLDFDSTSEEISLNVTNFSWLQVFENGISVFCFTDADVHHLLHLYPSLEVLDLSNTFLFTPFKYPGYYWCEAFKSTNLENVKSEMIFIRPVECFEFVAVFQLEYPTMVFNPLSSNTTDYISNEVIGINQTQDGFGTKYVPRIMKIVGLDVEEQLITISVHFSSDVEINLSEGESRFYSLKESINQVLNFSFLQMTNFSSSDFCASEATSFSSNGASLTWPTTPIDKETISDPFCFGSDGTVVTRSCTGNFNNGAQWSRPGQCAILESSIVSPFLVPLYDNPDETNDDKVFEIFQNYSSNQLSALDIYLTGEIYGFYIDNRMELDLDKFATVVDKILDVERSILKQSQVVARATNKFLNVFDNLFLSGESEPIIRNNLVLLERNGSSGIVVELVDGNNIVTVLDETDDNWTPEQIVKQFKNLQFGVWLTPELKKAIGEVPTVITLFFNDALFTQSSINVTTVFEVLFENISKEEVLPGPIKIIQKLGQEEVSCLTWSNTMDQPQDTWIISGTHQSYYSFQVCDFWYSSNFAMSYDDGNVTNELENLLNPYWNEEDIQRLEMLSTISQKYKQFQANDIYLVGEILTLVTKSDSDLSCLAKTVNNMHKIDKSVLSASEVKHKATDMILYNVDTIVKTNNQLEILITMENFVLFVTTKGSNVTGLVLRGTKETLKVEVVTGDQVPTYDDFISSIMLSPELRNQIPDDEKIIITVFSSDAFFNEVEPKSKSVGNIFGVVLPDIGNYSGPIAIMYNTSGTKINLQCAHWNYTTTNDSTSFWKGETTGSKVALLTQCEFWHTTHFGFLLMDADDYSDFIALDLITIINSTISLFGLAIIILTALLFEKWRKNIGNQILLNLTLAIVFQIVMFYIVGFNKHHSDYVYCSFIGILLQYFQISEFFWMLIIGVLQFRRFVKVFAPSPQYLLLKACLLGWVPPIIPVSVSLILNNGYYDNGLLGFCYPSGLGLYLGVWAPMGIIALINLIIFIYIVYHVVRSNVESSVVRGQKEGKHQWRFFILLFFMLGLTWTFGFMAELGLVFIYLFCFTATLQGFVLFLYFIVFNGNTRRMYIRLFKNMVSSQSF